MLKKYRKTMIITTILLLLPLIAALILWNRLPDTVVTHWNSNWEPDGWSSKPLATLGLPVFMLALQWLCPMIASIDPKKQNLFENKAFVIVLWVIPVLSLVCNGATLCYALGYSLNIEKLIPVLLGVLFIVIGNFLPKCRPSYTMGIRLPWTLADEENWRRTHRLAGPLWVVGGAVMMLNALVESVFPLFFSIVLMVGVPVLYSCLLYKKMHK